MGEFRITDEVYKQLKDLKCLFPTEEKKLLIDKLILNEEIKKHYKKYGLCEGYKQPFTYSEWCQPINVQNNDVYGILPYVAPEVLRGKGYTQKSDIYGFGIIAYEVCTELSPYHDIAHDRTLAIKICQGLRPKSNYKIP
jgi:serine/threonine protein kinase